MHPPLKRPNSNKKKTSIHPKFLFKYLDIAIQINVGG